MKFLNTLTRRSLLASALLAFASLAAQTAAYSAEIRVVTSGAFTEASKNGGHCDQQIPIHSLHEFGRTRSR